MAVCSMEESWTMSGPFKNFDCGAMDNSKKSSKCLVGLNQRQAKYYIKCHIISEKAG